MAKKSQIYGPKRPFIGSLTPEQMREWAAELVAKWNSKGSKTRCGPRPSKEERLEMRRQIIERDGNDVVCYWCQSPFPKLPSGEPDPFYATLEHIVPLYLRGKHVLHNCALACRKCNHERRHEEPVLADNTN